MKYANLKEFAEEARKIQHKSPPHYTDEELKHILKWYEGLIAFFQPHGQDFNPVFTGLILNQQSFVNMARFRGWDV